MISHYPKQLQVHCKNRRKNYGRQIVHFAVLTCRPHFYRLVVYRLTFPAYNSKREILQNSAVRVPHQIEAQRSGFDLERRGKGAERSFKAAPKRDRLETEWSGFRPDVKSAGDFDTNAHPCRIGGADFLLYETTQQGGCKPIQDSELLEAFEPYIAAFLGK